MTNETSSEEIPEIIKRLNRACLSKKPVSLEVANKIVDKHARRGTAMYYYKCELCKSYHITSHQPLPSPEGYISVV